MVSSRNTHKKTRNTHKKTRNTHKKTRNTHKKTRNTHKKTRNTHKKTRNTHKKTRNTHKKIKHTRHINTHKHIGGNPDAVYYNDITNVLGDDYHHVVIDTGKGYSIIPKITVKVSDYTMPDEPNTMTLYNIEYKIQYINPQTNTEVSDFYINTQFNLDEGMKKLFMSDQMTFKIHPLYFLFFQGTRDSNVSSCPSMGIHVEDEFLGLGLARYMIQIAIYAMDKITEENTLQKYFGLPLNEQIFAIDGDGSDGFWDNIGMVEHRAGYHYSGSLPLRCVGMEKIITIGSMRKWAFSK
jgi:hypothetical protein